MKFILDDKVVGRRVAPSSSPSSPALLAAISEAGKETPDNNDVSYAFEDPSKIHFSTSKLFFCSSNSAAPLLSSNFKSKEVFSSSSRFNLKHRRTLRYALSLAAEKAFPGKLVVGGRAVGAGYLYFFEDGSEMTEADVATLRVALQQLIDTKAPIVTEKVDWKDAIAYFNAKGLNMYECLGCLENGVWAVKKEGKGITCVGDLNKLEANNRDRKNFILASEFMQEAGIVDIVKTICERPDPEGMLPSNVDHYYLPLNRQPKYQERKMRSDVDYDHIESMDIELVNEHIATLIKGGTINVPKYNMKTGFRDGNGTPFKIPKGGILVIEGIHALNPNYTSKIPRDQVFKVFLSPITSLSVDEADTIKSTDSRLMRRMSRDYLFRGNSASRTLAMWHNVRRGEGTWIFPFQNEADYVMNSAHEYEICVLKPFVEPLLKGVPPTDANFDKAQELLRLLDKVHAWNERDVPSTSLLREFLGNGAFDEH
eukprot:jgi/Bigna1/146375/aug1.113_g21083